MIRANASPVCALGVLVMGRDTLGIKLDKCNCVLARSIGFLEKPFQIDAVVVGVIGEGR